MAKLESVFGISSKPILSYITRPAVDGSFVDAVRSDHHILIYGASKQGKTALRQKHVAESECVVYRCGPTSTPERIYQHVLKAANVRIETSETKTESSKATGKATWSVKAAIPWFVDANAGVEGGGEKGQQKSLTTEFVDVHLGDSQMVATILQTSKFKKIVVLENFHYLNRDVQRDLSFDLKTFHEMSIRFMILGVWRESNQLMALNPDLQDRITEIAVEPWSEDDFDKVINAGEKELNIKIPVKARYEFKKNSYGNVGMVQEFLRVYCKVNGVLETRGSVFELDSTSTIEKTLSEKAEDQRGRLLTVLEGISAKSRPDRRVGGGEPLTLPYYLVRVLLTAPINELRDGITRVHLLEKIRDLHRRLDKETIRISDVAHLLKRLPTLQEDSRSPFLYYDSNQKRLRIVDAGLLFALAHCDRSSIEEEILDPMGTYDDTEPEFIGSNEEEDGADEFVD